MWGWWRAFQGRLIARGQGDRVRSRLSFCCKMERWVDGPPVRTGGPLEITDGGRTQSALWRRFSRENGTRSRNRIKPDGSGTSDAGSF